MAENKKHLNFSSNIIDHIQKYYEQRCDSMKDKSTKTFSNIYRFIKKCLKFKKQYETFIPEAEICMVAKQLDIRIGIQERNGEITYYYNIRNRKLFHFNTEVTINDISQLELYEKRMEDNAVLTLICSKFGYDPTPETLSIVREKLKHREYGYKMRDAQKIARYIQIRDIVTVEDYILDMRMYDPLEKSILYNEGKPLNKQEQLIHDELQKIQDLNGQQLKSISPENYKLLEECIANTKQPLWISSLTENKLLVTETIDCITISFTDLCKMILDSDVKCNYCNITMSLIHEGDRPPTTLTIDAVYPMYGHRVDNTVLCCLQCNIRKGMNYAYDPADKIEHCV